MALLAGAIRTKHGRTAHPSMVMIDAQTVKGGRAGPTFHDQGGRGGRTIGAKSSILIEILGLPLAVRVDSARPHDVSVGRELLADHLPELPLIQAIVADRGYRGLAKLASRKHVKLEIKAPPKRASGFTPLAPLLPRRARVRSARALAAVVALLRRHRGERTRLARSRLGRLPLRPAAGRADLTSHGSLPTVRAPILWP
jgi:hypothetical protein